MRCVQEIMYIARFFNKKNPTIMWDFFIGNFTFLFVLIFVQM